VVKNAGLKPEDAVKAITAPKGFSVSLFAAEPDIVQPIAFCIDDRGRLWVAEGNTYPKRAPEGQGKDNIVIFEDTDGDGKFDKRTVFATGLNLVSGIEVGHGGLFVGAAPYFMFIPDKNGDDKPDGPPEILLDGFDAIRDTHETLNAFTWGPDGWLYGCHGVFTDSRVGKPGTADAERTRLNCGIWRFHPTKNTFEVFAHGTSNSWGVDFNDYGQCFETACVVPHLFHMIQGGRFERQANQHFNPYTYNDIKNIADHRHWNTGSQHQWAANNFSDAYGGGHAHAGAMIYLGDSFPQQYRNSIFMGNIHGNRFNNDILVPDGSGYIGKHGPDFLLMNDKWSRLINLKYGPDGGVYFIDWYDKQACHVGGDIKAWDRGNGRVYKVTYNGAKSVTGTNIAALSDAELVKLQTHNNDWYVRHARRILAERKTGGAELLALLKEQTEPTKHLRALWALHGVGGLTEEIALGELKNPSDYVRAWTIQLLCENAAGVSEPVLKEFTRLAADDPSPVVRLYIASAMQRVPVDQRWEVLGALVKHAEDAADHNIPLMVWYALEPLAAKDPTRALKMVAETKLPELRQFVVRRGVAKAK
jgi:putative membrane-bound dehydrogenase-like protein